MTCTTTCIQPSPSQCHCSVCHITFAGPTLFDAHRRGEVDDRHCMRPEQMTDRGLPLKLDERGIWRSGTTRPTAASGEPQSDQNRPGVAEPAPDAQNGPEAESEWICFPCGYHNTGGICTHCGWIRAAERAREDA